MKAPWRLLGIAAGLLVSETAAAAPATSPPCADPVIGAAFKLEQAKQFDRAQSIVASLLTKPQMARCAADMAIAIEASRKASADGPVAKAFDDFTKSGLVILVWAGIALVAVVLALAIGGFIRFASLIRRSHCKPTWRVRYISPGSDPAILSAWRTAMERAATREYTNSNLLIQSGLPLPKGIVSGGHVGVETEHLFDGAPEIQGISLSWLSKITPFLVRQCQSPRRTLSVTVTSHEKSAIVSIEACGSDAKVRATTAAAVWTSDADVAEEIDKMAAALALKTNYLIADDATDVSAAERMQLYKGIEELNAYSERNDSAALKRAAETFHAVRQTNPAAKVATLYEGIATELLEEHDRAQRLFEDLGAATPITATTEMVELQAAYNLAVTKLRRYKPDMVVAAEAAFETLAASINNLPIEHRTDDKVGVQAFALAAAANAIAHKFIFWERIGITGPKDRSQWDPTDIEMKARELELWLAEAERLIRQAEAQLATPYFAREKDVAIQLRWLIGNAAGNLALNRANCAGPTGIVDSAARATVLDQALAAFQSCEALFKPGVETLTNIATTFLALNRPTEALGYTRQARALNPRYEYAYMREYQAQAQRDDWIGKSTILSEASRTLGLIKIPEFQQIFRDAGVRYHDR